MKIGFLISSLSQSIPCLTFLVSQGYDVFPILSQGKINYNKKTNSFLISLIEQIVDRPISYDYTLLDIEKMDCMLMMADSDTIKFLKNINYTNFLKENGHIIFYNFEHESISELQNLLSIPNVHIVNCQPSNTIDNCNTIVSNMKLILQKK